MSYSYADYGLNEQQVDKRTKIEKEHQEFIAPIVNDLLEKLKNNPEWQVISMEELKKKIGNNALARNRAEILYALQANKNVIAKPQSTDEETGEAGSTMPVEYRYVPEEKKEELGYEAYFLRKFQGEKKKALEKALDKHRDELKVPLANVLIIIQQLYTDGAADGWISSPIVNLSRKTGMPLDSTKEMKLLIMAKVPRKLNKNIYRVFSRLTFTDEEYEVYSKEAGSGNIKEYQPPKKRRKRRKTNPPEEKKHYSVEDIMSILDDNDSDKIEVSNGENKGKTSNLSSLDDLLAKYRFELEELISRQRVEKQKIIDDKQSMINKLAKESGDKQSKIDELNNQLRAAKERDRANNDFNGAFVEHAQEVMDDFVGQFVSIIEEMSTKYRYQLNDPSVVNKLKRRAFDLVGEASKSIVNYRPDKVPPALYK